MICHAFSRKNNNSFNNNVWKYFRTLGCRRRDLGRGLTTAILQTGSMRSTSTNGGWKSGSWGFSLPPRTLSFTLGKSLRKSCHPKVKHQKKPLILLDYCGNRIQAQWQEHFWNCGIVVSILPLTAAVKWWGCSFSIFPFFLDISQCKIIVTAQVDFIMRSCEKDATKAQCSKKNTLWISIRNFSWDKDWCVSTARF